MNERMRVYGRYAVLQVPGLFVAGTALWALERWTDLTPALAVGLFVLWMLKDLALFPVTRVAYERGGHPHGADALVGARGRTRQTLDPDAPGTVQVGAELWRAQLARGEPALPDGAPVRVAEVRGLTLVVERAEP